MISLLPTLQLNSFFMIMWILYFKWDTLRCDILQETDCFFFRTVCKSMCVWWGPVCSVSARKLNRSPGSETSCSFSRSEIYALLRPHNTNSAKRQNGCKPLHISRFTFLPLPLCYLREMFWFTRCLKVHSYQQLFLVHHLPKLNIVLPVHYSHSLMITSYSLRHFGGNAKE